VQTEAGNKPESQLKHLYLLTLSRPASTVEIEIGLKLMREVGQEPLRQLAHLILGLNEFIYVN